MATFLNITDLVNKAKGDVESVVKRFTFSMFARVIMRTPVDTGRARANWILGFGAPAGGTTESFDRGAVSQNGVGSSSTKNVVQSQLMGTSHWIGSTVFLTNNLNYAYFLEYGRNYKSGPGPGSKQAPFGMVRVTVNEFAEVLGQSMPYAGLGSYGV